MRAILIWSSVEKVTDLPTKNHQGVLFWKDISTWILPRRRTSRMFFLFYLYLIYLSLDFVFNVVVYLLFINCGLPRIRFTVGTSAVPFYEGNPIHLDYPPYSWYVSTLDILCLHELYHGTHWWLLIVICWPLFERFLVSPKIEKAQSSPVWKPLHFLVHQQLESQNEWFEVCRMIFRFQWRHVPDSFLFFCAKLGVFVELEAARN